jgi:PAS domain S-box-containing protein
MDITDLNRISGQVKEKTKFQEDILKFFPGYFFIFNLEHQKITFANQAFGELVGYTTEALQAMDDQEVTRLFHPEDQKKIQTHLKKIKKAKGSNAQTIKFRLVPKNKEAVWVESVDKPFEFNENGTVKTILSFLSEIPA